MTQGTEQETAFETVFRHSKDGLAIFKNGVFVDCNQSMLDLVSLDEKEQFIGRTPIDFSPEYQFDGRPSAEKAMELINRCYEEGSVRFEWIHIRSDGTPFWCEVIITKMVLDGDLVVQSNWRDISEKKDLELKLAEQKEIFETLFKESMDALAIFDGQQYLDCNKAFLNMFGFKKKEDVIGLHPKNLSPELQPDGRESKIAARDIIQDCMDKGSVRFEWLHQKAYDAMFWTEVIITRVVLNGVDSIYAIIRDISEKKQLEFQLYERNAELDQSNRNLQHSIANLKQTQDKLVESEKMASLGSLVAGIAHEINTPVGVGLMGITQFIEETQAIRKRYQQGQLDEEMFEQFLSSASDLSNMVNKNLERTAHLVRSFKQIAVDQTSEEDRAINLRDYIQEIIFSLSSVTRKAKANISIDCSDSYNVVTNPGLLSQVVTNLVVNSITHGFRDRLAGNIDIALRERDKKHFVLIYKDDGKGISKENLPKIFDPFFTTNRANGGTGLGLNVTYNIVNNALGGSIKCRSEENSGVEFTIVFEVKKRM
ncbi:PAS domain-containing sensor histidine kinase [Marinobacterium lutimaris]|uniref:histidine kinase n=1 Tax=Marinobacterium lutimaris TaxID=568106 RepID=A0A1H6C4K9_9GAMM|nr:PAS domain-containing sensor histidine kinase [Marinobacterium lutimaris]SEG67894.1 PAS domain S-box-containing protein [Marinobacterium lutimaris]